MALTREQREIAAAFSAAGIVIDKDTCSFSDLQDKLSKLIKDQKDEAEKVISNLSYKSFGNFFVLTAALLKEFLGGAAAKITDKLVNEALFDNILGAVNTGIALILASVPGAQLVIQYYAAATLQKQLRIRLGLADILISEINAIITWLDVFSNFGDKFDSQYLINLTKAKEEIGEATKTIGLEISAQNSVSPSYISSDALQYASDSIDDGLSYLSPGYELITEDLDRVQKDLELETVVPAITKSNKGNWINLEDWTKYISDLWEELSKKYDPKNEEDSVALKSAIFRMLPILPEFLRKFTVNYVIKNSSDILIERIPIWALKQAKDQKWMDWTLTPPSEFTDFVEVLQDKREYTLFSKSETKDITWQRIMNSAKLSESSLLLIPTYMETIKLHSSMVKTILTPAYNHLKSVHDDMTGTIADYQKDPASARQDATTKKFSVWTTKLLSAKGMLSTARGGSGLKIKGYGETVQLTSAQVTDKLFIINQSLEALEDFIETKNTDGNEVGDNILTIANRNLLALAGQAAAFVLHPGLSGSLIANLRAIQTLLREQVQLDTTELLLVTDFVTKVKSFPGFAIIKKYVDSLIKKMQEGNAAITKDLVNSLKSGDLATVSSYLDVADFGVNAANCLGKQIGIDNVIPEKDSILAKLDTGIGKLRFSEKWQKRTGSAMTYLKKKWDIANVLTLQLSELIKETPE